MNKQLLEHYIEAYGTDIYSFCIRLTQNREQAEELYQDTFLAMCEKEDWKEVPVNPGPALQIRFMESPAESEHVWRKNLIW